MPEFADESITIAIPKEPSIGWLKKVAHAAKVWPDVDSVPDAIWNAVLTYQKAMVKVAGEQPSEAPK